MARVPNNVTARKTSNSYKFAWEREARKWLKPRYAVLAAEISSRAKPDGTGARQSRRGIAKALGRRRWHVSDEIDEVIEAGVVRWNGEGWDLLPSGLPGGAMHPNAELNGRGWDMEHDVFRRPLDPEYASK